ncbi:polyhydroxyalkanoate synthesis regulator DNA-binding domain-containing protein [Legionella adelaidensis]|nr:polyhydroxyalkanoate synthesis regulator DNA-binding domain-containing protein [Legionella adelaidensis]
MSRLIKKYKNRRLYDIETSKYITMEDLQQYVLDNIPFQVQDSGSGKDLTNLTLLQILVEMEATSTHFLSPDVLRQLICLAHHPMHKKFKSLLEQMLAFMSENPANTFFSQWQTFYKNHFEE